MTNNSTDDSLPHERQLSSSAQEVVDGIVRLATSASHEPRILWRGFLELAAAQTLQSRTGGDIDSALDSLGRRLDLQCLLLQPEHLRLRDELLKVLSHAELGTQAPELRLALVGAIRKARQRPDRARTGAHYLPDWLGRSLVQLADPERPAFCLHWGDALLAAYILLEQQVQYHLREPAFLALDRDKTIVDNLRLILSLTTVHLETIAASTLLQADASTLAALPSLGGTSSSLLGQRYGTVFVNLFSSGSGQTWQSASLYEDLPAKLSRWLSPDGRAVFFSPSLLLESEGWRSFRSSAQAELQLESVVEFGGTDVFADAGAFGSVLVTLRQRQQAISRSITLMGPATPDAADASAAHLIGDLVSAMRDSAGPEAGSSTVLFERPTAEILDERWDPKFYSPARATLQDRLISDPEATWLGVVAEFIRSGAPPHLLTAYTEADISVTLTTEQRDAFAVSRVGAGVALTCAERSAIAFLRVGDQVRLQRELEHPTDPNAVRVERRSGTILGYLPQDIADGVAEAIDDLGGTHWATVSEIGRSTGSASLSIKIRFVPPDSAEDGVSVTVVRPRDVVENRLSGGGEIVWLPDQKSDRVTRLQAGDILLFLGGLHKACVVSREYEGAVCTQGFAIIRPNDDVDPVYLLSHILGSDFQEQLYFVARGGTVSAIRPSDLDELIVVVPSIATQRRVAMAYAESHGELAGSSPTQGSRWFRLLQEDRDPRQKLAYSLLSALFSDWDQIDTLNDWLRLKAASARDLRNSAAHGMPWFRDGALNQVLLTLGDVSKAIEHAVGTSDPSGAPWTSARQTLEAYRQSAQQVSDRFLRSQLLMVATRLGELLRTESRPLPIRLSLEETVFPAGIVSLLSLSVTNRSTEAIEQLEIVPSLGSDEIIERPPWRLFTLDPGESHTFEARVRLNGPQSLRLGFRVVFSVRGVQRQRIVELPAEAVPLDQIPFSPIHPNPYITGGAVDTPAMFFGRQDVLDYLTENLLGEHQSNVIVLQGNRRTGKSSVLKQIVNLDLFAPHVAVYVDCQGLGTLTDQRFFYKLGVEIWKALARRDGVSPPQRIRRSNISEDDPFYDFQAVLDDLTSAVQGSRIVLLIDEFEVLDMAVEAGDLSSIVLENLRHLFQHRHDLAVVLTGSYRLKRLREDYWSILFGLGLKHEIGFLDVAAARQLIVEPLKGKVAFSEEAVERIIQLSACQPYFIQMVCHDVVNVLNRQHVTYVTQTEVEAAAQEALTSADGHLRYMFDQSGSPQQQAVIVYLASRLQDLGAVPQHEIERFLDEHRLPITRAEIQETLRGLADRDLVEIDGPMGQRQYRFKIDLVRQWIRRNCDLQSYIVRAQDTAYLPEG